MLVPSIYCATGSFVHTDHHTASKIKRYIYVIIATYTFDVVTALALSILATFGFFSIPGVTINLSFTAKVLLLVGGVLIIIGDSAYLIYRLNRASEKIKQFIKKLESKNDKKIDQVINRVNEKITKWDAMARSLENKMRLIQNQAEEKKKEAQKPIQEEDDLEVSSERIGEDLDKQSIKEIQEELNQAIAKILFWVEIQEELQSYV